MQDFFSSLPSSSFSQSDFVDETPVAIGCKKSSPSNLNVSKQTCILCQEEQEITHQGKAMVLSAFVQK